MKKRVLSLLLVVAMLASLVVFPAYATDGLCPCGCGANAEDVTWEAWTNGTNPKQGGHYRLYEDLVTAMKVYGTSKNDNDFTLDLYGHVWRANDGDRLMKLGSITTAACEVTILDTVGGGEMQATGVDAAEGGVIWMDGACTLNIKGGTIRQLYDPEIVVRYGGVIAAKGDTKINLSGGTITDGFVVNNLNDNNTGGNVRITGNCEFTMTGGEIVNGRALKGGGIYVASNTAAFNMSGGTLSNNIAYHEGATVANMLGGNIYNVGILNISGDAVVKNGVAGCYGGNIYNDRATATLDGVSLVDGDIYTNNTLILKGTVNIPMGNSNGIMVAKGKVLDVTNMDAASKVFFGVNLANGNTATFTTGGGAELIDCFKNVGRTGAATVAETELSASAPSGGGTWVTSYCPHCGEDAEPVEWCHTSVLTNATNKPLRLADHDHFYCNNATNFTATVTDATANLHGQFVLDLWGQSQTNTAAKLTLSANMKAAVLDTVGGGKLTGGNSSQTHAGIIVANAAGTKVDIYSGILTGTSQRAGAVYMAGGTVNVHGGIIANGVSTNGNGAGIYVNNAAGAVNISGGLFTGGDASAAGRGGNVYTVGNMTITGGIFENGKAMYNGGNIGMGAAAGTAITYKISNALIRGGETTVASTRNGFGGNIGLVNYGQTLEIDNCTIAAGTTASAGGNIGAKEHYALTVTDSVIYGGSANGSNGDLAIGGNIQFGYKDTATTNQPISLTNTIVFDGTANTNGGNIYIQKASAIDMTNCVVANGHGAQGGNIYIRGNSTVDAANLTNVRIYNGTAGDPAEDTNVRTDNVFVATSIVLDNVVIKGSSNTKSYGSGLNLRQSAGTNAVVATLKNNTVIGNVNDPFDASLAIETGTAVGSLVVDASFRGSVVLSPQGLFGYTEGVSNLTRDLPYGTALVNATSNGDFAGKLYLGDHKTEELAVWTYGMPAITRNGDTLVVDEAGAIVNGKHYDLATALDMTKNKSVVLQPVVTDLTLEDGTYYIDVNGRNVNVSGAATVYGIDTATDDHANVGTGTLVAAEGVTVKAAATNPVTGDAYVRTVDTEKYEFHHIDMDITSVVLRTGNAGVYYKGTWACDADLAAYIAEQGENILYGVVASVDNMPENSFDTDIDDAGDNLNCWSYNSGAAFTSGTVVNGALVTGIMKDSYENAVNTNNAGIPIYAKAYLMVTEDDSTESYIVGKTGANKSLMDMLVKIDTSLASNPGDLTSQGDVTTLMNNFYNTWKDLGLQAAIDAQEHVFTQVCFTPAVSDESTEA